MIPLPVTGAYTGSFAAWVFGIEKRKGFCYDCFRKKKRMPITKSAKKALRQNLKRRKLNIWRKRRLREMVKKFQKLVVDKKINEAFDRIDKIADERAMSIVKKYRGEFKLPDIKGVSPHKTTAEPLESNKNGAVSLQEDIVKNYINQFGDEYRKLIDYLESETEKFANSFSGTLIPQFKKTFKTLPQETKQAWEEYKAQFPELAEYVKKEAEAIGRSYKEGFVPEFKEISSKIKQETTEWEKIMKEAAEQMQQNFSDFFYDVFMGKIHSMKDALGSFLKSLQSAIARIASNKLAEGIMDFATGLFKRHEGGYIPRFHIGGLAADEVPAVLQKGEYVIRKSGVELLNRINKRDASVVGAASTVEQYQPVVVNMNINTTDPITFETYIKQNKGAIQKMIIRDMLNNGQVINAIRETL